VVSGVEARNARSARFSVASGWLRDRLACNRLWTVRVPIRGSLSLATFRRRRRGGAGPPPDPANAVFGRAASADATVRAGPRMSVTFDDVSALSDADRDRALARQHEEELAADIPLEGAPLLRLRLSRVGPDEHVLLASGHHIVSDAHSAWVLLAELFEQCRRLERGEAMTPRFRKSVTPTVLAHARQRSPDPFWRESTLAPR